METDQWLHDFKSKLADLKRKSEDLQENLAAATSTAVSRDGAVTVTVGPNGGLQDLRLGHRAMELGAARLTALVLETARTAQSQVVAKVHEAFEPLGAGTEAMAMYMDAVPDDLDATAEPEDDQPVADLRAPAAPAKPPGAEDSDEDGDEDGRPW